MDSQLPQTVLVLTEEALQDVDAQKILGLHAEVEANYRVLVPADTDHNVLAAVLDGLSLFDMRATLDALKPVDRSEAQADAATALSESIAKLSAGGADVTGEVTSDDPVPALIDEANRLAATAIIVVTQPHAVEDTFHTDWASEARKAIGLPVLHMYAGDWRLG